METVLSVHDCAFSYGDGEFRLAGVNLEVRAGEMLGIVGPNGSGKSTLLRLMAGILRASAGQVRVGGRPVREVPRRELAREVAFLPQSPASSFEFTVREVVALGRHPYQGAFGLLSERDRDVVDEVLGETEAAPLADRYFSTLSGGEKQRVLVASVLAQEPRIMLLDEPGAALDVHHKSHVLDLLWSLSRRDMAVVVVTHDLNAAGRFCDRLALLREGSLVEAGPPRQVMREDMLSQAYETPVRVVEHPITSQPMVLVLGRMTDGKDQG